MLLGPKRLRMEGWRWRVDSLLERDRELFHGACGERRPEGIRMARDYTQVFKKNASILLDLDMGILPCGQHRRCRLRVTGTSRYYHPLRYTHNVDMNLWC